MGASWEQVGTLNAVQAASLGTLDPSGVRTVPADGSSAQVVLAPVSGTDGVRAVRLAGHGGRQYWLELRTPTGQDAWLATDANRFGLEAGVLVRRVGDWPDTSLLLDPTPTAGRQGDPRTAVHPGTTARLAGGFAVTVTELTADGATLAIASTASPAAGAGTDTEPEQAGTGAPEVLEGQGGAGTGTGTGTLVPGPEQVAPAAADGRPEGAAAPADLRPGPVEDAAVAAGAQPAGEPEQVAADAAGPAVVPASGSRSFVPVAAGGVLAGAAVAVAGQLFRTRARR
jgi:hypothetical protein